MTDPRVPDNHDAGFDDVLAHPRDGVPASSPSALVRPQAVVETVVDFVHMVQASPLPHDAELVDIESAFAAASRRVAAGLVDSANFDEAYRSQTAQQMLVMADSYRTILAARPATTLVRVHGDLDLDTLVIDDGRIVGWTPVPVRVGDPFADYAALARSFIAKLGPGAILSLFERLDVTDPDPIRLEYWVCIGQLR